MRDSHHPAKHPSRMSILEWSVDAWDAMKCAKAGIPLAEESPPTPTGRQSEIGRAADTEIAKLRRDTQIATHGQEAELARLREVIGQLQVKINEAVEQETAIIDRRPDRLLPVEADVPESIIASRRAADNRQEAAPIRRRIDELVAQREELAAQAAKLDHEIEMRWRRSRSHARAVGEVARRREARYWRLLCRRHPEGARLASLFDHPRIALARWVDGPADERNM